MPERPLHIAIDASRSTRAQRTGTEHYAQRLIEELIRVNAAQPSPQRLTLYFRDQPAKDLFPQDEHVTQRVIPFARMWTHIRLAAALWQDRPDLTFVPAHTLPFIFPGKAVVTVHDMGYKHFPEAHPWKQRLYLDLTTRYSARRATRILVDSEATGHDLARFYGIPTTRMARIYPGVDALPLAQNGSDLERVRNRYDLPRHYFLFIGTLQPRKNIARMVEAFGQWRRAHPELDLRLVLAGAKGWLFDEAWVQNQDGVVITGYIDEADKGPLMAGARALLFPSLYEGFGFPVIEAMQCGTPVIASNSSSLPELVGDAGILVDPLSVASIVAALDLIMWREDLRRSLRSKGYEQAEQFTWQNSAALCYQVLLQAAQSGS